MELAIISANDMAHYMIAASITVGDKMFEYYDAYRKTMLQLGMEHL